MEARQLNARTLAALRKPRPYPAISLTMPTHRRDPGSTQDPVRLRNLIAEAKRRLEEDPNVPRSARLELAARLDRIPDSIDFVHLLDGLVILLTEGEEAQAWRLPREVPERVVFADTYLTRNLVAANIQTHPFWVLAVDGDRATLWSGDDEELRELKRAGFPQSAAQNEDWDVQRKERKGDSPSTFQDEATREYLRAVDASLARLLEDHPRPLYLVGLPAALALLDEVGTTARTATGRITLGGLTDGPAHALLQELRPALDVSQREATAAAMARLDLARGRHAYASGLDEVWKMSEEGRVQLLVVEEHFLQTASVAAEHLAPVAGALHEPDAREDVVDELIEQAMDMSAEVAFVPDDALADSGRIAAELRF